MKKTYWQNSGVKKCAFCKYWYDPTNSCISPKPHFRGVWEYEDNMKSTCTKCGHRSQPAWSSCGDFECKI